MTKHRRTGYPTHRDTLFLYMQAGRPLKFQSVEELDGIDNCTVEVSSNCLKNKDFINEKDLEKYIILNIDNFVKEFFEDKLVSFEVDYPVDKQHFSPRGRRVDLYIKGVNKSYIIELKCPNSGTENRAAIGQLLDYGREFLDSKKELVLITTSYDYNTAKTIKYYNLPIRYVFLDKKRSLEFLYSND